MTETPKESAPGLPQTSRTAAHRDTRLAPIHLTASPDLVDLALAYVTDGSISRPETPALLRRIAFEHLAAVAACGAAVDCTAPPPLPIPEGFVLVDYEIRPGVRSYRLAKVPENVAWRIRIGAFERHVHRTFVLFVRRLVRFFTAQMVLAQEWKAGLLARSARASG
ncbi:MAG: hypothetical protein U0529_19965 [Thermoanaerobaculia bacterium]